MNVTASSMKPMPSSGLSITLRLEDVDPADSPLVQIFDDVGTNPGSLLYTLANPAFPSSGCAMACNTPYGI